MAITKLESAAIKAFVSANKDDKTLFPIASDHTNMKVSKTANALLECYMQREDRGKVGKSKFLRGLLDQFHADQKPIFHMECVDTEVYNSSTLKALQISKNIFRYYVGDDIITTQSDIVIALLVYTTIRKYELAKGLRTTSYLDCEYEELLEMGEILPPVIKHDPLANIKDLFETAQSMRLPIPEVE